MPKNKINNNQLSKTQSNLLLRPINKSNSLDNINGVDPLDPTFFAKLNKNLKPNQEIRVKRIYHVNKPLAEPENDEISIQNEDFDEYDDESDNISDDSHLSNLTNPASVIRTSTKSRIPVETKHHYETHLPLPILHQNCLECEMENHRKLAHSYHNIYNPLNYPTAPNPYFMPSLIPCRICSSQQFNSVDHLNNMPQLMPPTNNNIQSYYNSFHSSPPMYLPNLQMQLQNNQPYLLPNIPFREKNNPYYARNGNNSYSSRLNIAPERNKNKSPASYRELYNNKNRLIDYTYDKYSPRRNERNESSQSRTVRVYKDPE
jgi:hypothetical protein